MKFRCALRVYEGDEECWIFEVWRIRKNQHPESPPLPGADGVAPNEATAKRWAIKVAEIIGAQYYVQ